MESWRRNPWVFAVLALPGSFWLLVFFLVPLAIVWTLSFGEKTSIVDIAVTWTTQNYARALEPIYLEIIWKSVWISAFATALCLAIAYPIAFLISFLPPRLKTLLMLAVILPFWINMLIRTYALIAVFRRNGYVNFVLEWLWTIGNSVLGAVGLGSYQLLGSSFEPVPMLYNTFALMVGLVYVFLPFMVLPLYATIERLDKSYLEASLDLGASQFRTFFSVTLPLTMPGVVSGIILVFIPCLGSFLIPDLLGGTNAQMIGNVITRQFKEANDWPFGSALSFLLMYVTFLALALRSLFAGRGEREAV
ncbi:spermidine/putrescine transport system permease protein [Rhodoligotrophos appendicifer]|uniref:ABC transporter permease n=1 Tax=Rhodoligotrophos appendicifer TaxID=987056 RepID=UPI0011855617|nr:ABC transporter permease [Rhodoligotrophos appendicifer]